MASNGGSSSSFSQSTSTPVAIQTPQSQYELLLAQQAAQMGQNQYGWAQNQYGYLQGLANEAIPQYLQGAARSNQLANAQLDQYENMYLPAQKQFNEQANTYSSAARQALEAGKAEATATQAANAAWQNTRKQLQSAGVDPSSGEYAGLQAAANTAAGASAAGAGNQAAENTRQTGLGLQEQNINFGQTMPASALNAINTAYTGQTNAVNTGQSTVNTAANAFNSADQFYNTAANAAKNNGVSGQNSQSTSYSASNAGGHTPVPMGNISDSTGAPMTGVAQGGLIESNEYRRGGRVRRGRRGHGMKQPMAPMPSDDQQPTDVMTPQLQQAPPLITSPNMNAAQNGAAQTADDSGGGATPPTPPTGAPMDPNMGNSDADTGFARGGRVRRHHGSSDGTGDPGYVTGNPASDANMSGNVSVPSPMTGDPANDAVAGESDGYAGGGIPQPHGHQGRPHPPHPYQVNGLPDASTGGHVPYELSPSHGHTTDDVVANLNAGEFVIPRRTVHHLGHKALYDLIAKSDKEMGMHPQPVGPKPINAGSGAGKARSAAESQNFLNGGGI